MKLRYVFLPRSGPLTGLAVKFGSELPSGSESSIRDNRRGSINFVVGVNGSGKSTILRALFQAFRSLANGSLPAQPITVAWDWQLGEDVTTVIVCYSPDQTVIEQTGSWFAVIDAVPPETNAAGWAKIIENKGVGQNGEKQHRFGELEKYRGSSDFSAYLPSYLIAYTSGDPTQWVRLKAFEKSIRFEDDPEASTESDRPPDWNLTKEWNSSVEQMMSKIIEQFGTEGIAASARRLQLVEEFSSFGELKKQIVTNNLLGSKRRSERALFIGSTELRSAAVAFALTQVAKEMPGQTAEWQKEALRNQFLAELSGKASSGDARSVLNQIDWFAPTHLVLDYVDDEESLDTVQREQLLALLAISDEVVRQPDGSHRIIFSLGAFKEEQLDGEGNFDFSRRLESVFPSETYSATFEALVERVSKTRTGAEAVLRIFSSNDSIDSTLFEVFKTLLAWRESSIIRTLDLTVQRLGRYTSFDGQKDFSVVTLDQLSDGEIMLISRMALLFLLRDQNGALLLLDEPETHLNDRWKRELINWIEKSVLTTTSAQIVVSTHTSIVLTDALASEISVLQKTPEGVVVRAVSGGTYGTDPSEIMTNIYGADSSTGSSSLEYLDHLLTIDWTVEQIPVLEKILPKLGSSFHRAELRAKLEDLKRSLHGAV